MPSQIKCASFSVMRKESHVSVEGRSETTVPEFNYGQSFYCKRRKTKRKTIDSIHVGGPWVAQWVELRECLRLEPGRPPT